MWNVTIYIKGHDAGDRTIWVDNIKDVERRTRKKLSETIGLNGIKKYNKHIDTYCKKYYGKENVPHQFEAVKNFLINYITDSSFPSDPESFYIEPFEDENVKISYDQSTQKLSVWPKSKAKDEFAVIVPWIYISLKVDRSFKDSGFIYMKSVQSSFWKYSKYDISTLLWSEKKNYEHEGNSYPHPRASKYSSPSTPAASSSAAKSPQRKGLDPFEQAELNQAKKRYDSAVAERQRHPNSDKIYESLEKQAYADYLRVLTKYSGRE